MLHLRIGSGGLAVVVAAAVLAGGAATGHAQSDPGVRGGAAAAGGPIAGISANNQTFFDVSSDIFAETEVLADGLGPRFNLDSCGGCHSQPALGGSSPSVNPQVAVATASGAHNTLPSFITRNGPIREARFKSDGGVHSLFVISGRNDGSADATTCTIAQEDFATQVTNNNVSFRIPTPVFGLGLVEGIADSDLIVNLAANATQKTALGITGRFNRSGNDGTITRFGWKAQNKSLQIFAGEAYSVEMGISNEMFADERDGNGNCIFARAPNSITNTGLTAATDVLSDVERFAFFMRFVAPPTPSTTTPGGNASITRGSNLFTSVGCVFCHTASMTTHTMQNAELSHKPVNLFSDLALHHMGATLADGISQGVAAADEFRTAPLWGLGQRIFFLHDGRTADLVLVIAAHRAGATTTFPASEANGVVANFNALNNGQKQDLLNFLRSL
jgi:CxxC motif-containing protein (DUF1111 family)